MDFTVSYRKAHSSKQATPDPTILTGQGGLARNNERSGEFPTAGLPKTKEMADRPPGSNDNMQAMNSLNHEKTRANVDTLTDELIGHPSKDIGVEWHARPASSVSKAMQIMATDGAGDTGPPVRSSNAIGSLKTESGSEPEESPDAIDHSFWGIQGNYKNQNLHPPAPNPSSNDSPQYQLIRFTMVGGRGEREIQLQSACPDQVAYSVLNQTANELGIPGTIATAIVIMVTETVPNYHVIAMAENTMKMLNDYKPKRVFAVYGRVGNQEAIEANRPRSAGSVNTERYQTHDAVLQRAQLAVGLLQFATQFVFGLLQVV